MMSFIALIITNFKFNVIEVVLGNIQESLGVSVLTAYYHALKQNKKDDKYFI